MKLTGQAALAYFRNPEPDRAGLLLHGADAMRVALRREQVLKALLGETAAEEMRLTRIEAGELRRDPAALGDAMRATGFFPGARAVLVEGAGDGLTKTLAAALADWQAGDAMLVVTAAALPARSSLRKLFEGHDNAHAIGVYDDPPDRAEIAAILAEAGLDRLEPGTEADLAALAAALDPGEFRQTVEKLALYTLDSDTPATPADLAAVAPASTEAAIDDALHLIAEGRADRVGPLLGRLAGQGVAPTGLCIAALRHFRTLHAAACHPRGVEAGLSAARPPVFGPRRSRMARQAGRIGLRRLESIITLLIDTDLALRSAGSAPAAALVERAFIRVAMLARS